uniref:Uncharacterized protein n=1 Tax=Anguilla anguilla TaxID=7936 RepID=A0A0E9WYJ1_ANGAN
MLQLWRLVHRTREACGSQPIDTGMWVSSVSPSIHRFTEKPQNAMICTRTAAFQVLGETGQKPLNYTITCSYIF